MLFFKVMSSVVFLQQAVSHRARMEGCVSGLNSVCANQGPRAKPVRPQLPKTPRHQALEGRVLGLLPPGPLLSKQQNTLHWRRQTVYQESVPWLRWPWPSSRSLQWDSPSRFILSECFQLASTQEHLNYCPGCIAFSHSAFPALFAEITWIIMSFLSFRFCMLCLHIRSLKHIWYVCLASAGKIDHKYKPKHERGLGESGWGGNKTGSCLGSSCE